MDEVFADLHHLLGRRGRLLTTLSDEPKRKPELVDALDVSRSTVDRAVRELETAGVVERNGGVVALTTRGGVIVDITEYFADVASTIEALDDELHGIPADQRPHYAQFADATIITGTEAAPHRPVSELERELADVTTLRAVTLSVIPTLVETVRRRVLRDELEVEMVLSEAVLSRLLNSHADALEETVDNSAVTLYQTTVDLPYGISVFDGPDGPSSFLVLQGDGGIPAVVRSTDPKAVAWANTVIDRERSRAEPV